VNAPQRRESYPETLTEGVQRSSGSYELVFAAALFAFIGLGIDRWLGLFPLFTVICSFLGFMGGVASVYFRYRLAMAEATTARMASHPRTDR
jgi:F0F1-type ATP synthase assembly protein I